MHAAIAIDYHDADGLLIRTALGGRLQPLTGRAALGALARQPWLTVGVVVRIHWQAVRLLLKKVPFHGKHPGPGRGAQTLAASHDAVPPGGAPYPSSSIEEIES
jgi:DUF1365 family protein